MSRRPHAASFTQHRWMVSYLDVLTILLIFFLSAAATTWKNPPTQAANGNEAAVSDAPAEGKVGSQASRKDQAENDATESTLDGIEQTLKAEGLNVRKLSDTDAENVPSGGAGLAINLSQAVLFSPGDDRVRSEGLPDLRKIADALKGIPNRVNLAGHADATPIHNRRFRNNWELAAARSLRLMEVLTEQCGIEASRVSISSYGALEPKSPNDTPTGRASNRRVEILIFRD